MFDRANPSHIVASPAAAALDQEQSQPLARLLGSSTTARRLLKQFGSVRSIALAGDIDLADAGLATNKIKLLRNAFDLGSLAIASPVLGKPLQRASDVFHRFQAKLCLAEVEEFWAMATDARNRVIAEMMLARGCLSGVEVHPRDVFRQLIKAGAASVIFAHNHPSGDPSPSVQDIELTARLREVGTICGIAVLDHVVFGGDHFVSLAERGWR